MLDGFVVPVPVFAHQGEDALVQDESVLKALSNPKNLPIIIATASLSVSIIALVFSIIVFLYKRNFDLPIIFHHVYSQRNNLPNVLKFRLEDNSKWQITAIRICSIKPLIAPANKKIIEDKILGHPIEFDTDKPWQRRIKFNKAFYEQHVIFRPEIQGQFRVRYKICLRANPRTRRTIPMQLSLD